MNSVSMFDPTEEWRERERGQSYEKKNGKYRDRIVQQCQLYMYKSDLERKSRFRI